MRILGRAIGAVLTVLVAIGLVSCVRTEKVPVVPSPVQTSLPAPTKQPTSPPKQPASPPEHATPNAAPPTGSTHDCQALFNRGLTYDEVFAYWISLGSPQDMDDDHDGWPCETVYGQQNAPAPAGTHDCKVLFDQGLTYDEVFAYWISLGSPQDMDDDHDGWPCETVYGNQN